MMNRPFVTHGSLLFWIICSLTLLCGELVQYKDLYRLCYLRGPAGIIVALAEELF